MSSLKNVSEALKNADNIMVISHTSPDGDTLGSATALIRALQSMGKNVKFACDDTVGNKFMFLFDGVKEMDFTPEFFVSVDIASPQLMGKNADLSMDIVIDHHRKNTLDGKIKYVDESAASATVVVYELLKEMEVEIDKHIANSLFTGLSTDTGCFKFSNADARVHTIAADLINIGADSAEINRKMFDEKTKAGFRAERKIVSELEFFADDELVAAYIPRSIFDLGITESDLEGIPSIVRGIEGVKIAVTLKEKEDGMWKASVRSIDPYNACEVCETFGGGGHLRAGGCALTKDFEQSKNMLIEACKKEIEKHK